jgi:alpha-1,2-mannosyltransferase
MTPTPVSPHTSPVSRANRWLVLMLAACVTCSLLVFAAFRLAGTPPKTAFMKTGWSVVPALVSSKYNDDSWGPMGRAYLRSQSREDKDIYGIFFDEGRKFQYPPASLLVFVPMPKSWLSPENFVMGEKYVTLKGPLMVLMRTLSQLAVLITIAASVAILEIGIRRTFPAEKPSRWRLARVVMVSLLGLSFYPLMKGHELGQIQAILNALTAVGVLAHLLGWQAGSGFCLGLCCLAKPQYMVVAIWAVLRRNWRILTGLLIAVMPVGLAGLAVFGWRNHMNYIEVVRKIAKLGEAYWPNQCFNGFANRLIGNGDPVNFDAIGFAPYHPWIHAATVGTSLLILGLALFRPRAATASSPTLDLGIVIASATLASPVAWEHHYGAFFPLFALALPACLQPKLPVRILGLILGASFLAMGVAALAPEAFFSAWWRGWAASHLFYGAVLFFGLLWYLRQRSVAVPAAPEN